MALPRKETQMRKMEKRESSETGGRVLARVLAEDLRNIKVPGAAGSIQVTYDDGHGHMDMTNFPNDGYN